jgi:YbbR domain-containing protein
LVSVLEAFYDEIAPPPEKRSWARFLLRNYREKAVSFVLAVVLWVVVGYSAQTLQRTFEVPVNYGPLPSTLAVANVEPAKVAVTLSGQRKTFAFLKLDDIKVVLQLWEARKGKHRFTITSRDLSYPSGLELENIQPRQVLLDIENRSPDAKNNR